MNRAIQKVYCLKREVLKNKSLNFKEVQTGTRVFYNCVYSLCHVQQQPISILSMDITAPCLKILLHFLTKCSALKKHHKHFTFYVTCKDFYHC